VGGINGRLDLPFFAAARTTARAPEHLVTTSFACGAGHHCGEGRLVADGVEIAVVEVFGGVALVQRVGSVAHRAVDVVGERAQAGEVEIHPPCAKGAASALCGHHRQRGRS
jgi:hypothetical protein